MLPAIRTLAFSADGRLIAACGEPEDPSEPRRVRVFDARDGKPVADLEAQAAQVVSLEFSPDGKRLLAAAADHPRGVQVWEMPGGRLLRALPGGNGTARFVEGGGRIAIVDRLGASDVVRVHDMAGGQEVQRFLVEVSYRQGLGADADRLLAVRSLQAQAVRVIDLPTGRELARLEGSRRTPSELTLSPDGRTVAACDNERNDVLVWELATGRVVHRFATHTGPVLRLAFSPDGRRLVSGSASRATHVWELATGRQLHGFAGHTSYVSAVALSGDGRRLATGSFDHTIVVWDLDRTRKTFLAKGELDEAALEALWHDLAAADPSPAYRAIGTVALNRDAAMAYLDRRVESLLVPVRHEHIGRLIAELGDQSYIVRQRATLALGKLREAAKPLLLKTLRTSDSAEVRYRVHRILSDSEETARFSQADVRRMLRVVHAAGVVGDEASQRVLARIAADFPEDAMQKEAERTLKAVEAGKSE
ncbi:MAG: WD40 repeat domain-containing protein [Planctomycetales bacterium]